MSPQYTQAHKRVENNNINLSAIIPFSFGMPEAVMSNLRVHPQIESMYNDLGDLSNPDMGGRAA